MAVTLLVADNDEFIRLIIKTIRNDLQDSNELNCSLALQAIANIANKDMADSLTHDIFRLITSYVFLDSYLRRAHKHVS
jgi:AP-2 complex subunit alpha